MNPLRDRSDWATGAGQNPDDTSVDLTALVDVVFLLLIFFMLASSLRDTAALEIDLPEAEAGAAREQTLDILRITAEGAMYWNETPVLADIAGSLAEASGREVMLEADRRTPHEFVVKALEALQRAGAAGVAVGARSVPPRLESD